MRHKIISVFLAVVMVFSFTACGNSSKHEGEDGMGFFLLPAKNTFSLLFCPREKNIHCYEEKENIMSIFKNDGHSLLRFY